MHGGKVIWMIDNLYAEMDSLMRTQSDFVAFDRGLNLEDQLFRYGARINQDLVQDVAMRQASACRWKLWRQAADATCAMALLPASVLVFRSPDHKESEQCSFYLSQFNRYG